MKGRIRYNKSSVFLLPMLGIPTKHFKGFINAYCKCDFDKDGDDYRNRIYVVLAASSVTDAVLTTLASSKYYMKVINEQGVKIFVFKIPLKYISDYNYILKGKYSLTSDEYKELIKGVYGEFDPVEEEKRSKPYSTVYPTKQDIKILARKLNVYESDIKEILDSPSMQEETFKMSHLIEINV